MRDDTPEPSGDQFVDSSLEFISADERRRLAIYFRESIPRNGRVAIVIDVIRRQARLDDLFQVAQLFLDPLAHPPPVVHGKRGDPGGVSFRP